MVASSQTQSQLRTKEEVAGQAIGVAATLLWNKASAISKIRGASLPGSCPTRIMMYVCMYVG